MATMVFSNVGSVISLAIISISSKCADMAESIASSTSLTSTKSKAGTPSNGPIQGFKSILSESFTERSQEKKDIKIRVSNR